MNRAIVPRRCPKAVLSLGLAIGESAAPVLCCALVSQQSDCGENNWLRLVSHAIAVSNFKVKVAYLSAMLCYAASDQMLLLQSFHSLSLLNPLDFHRRNDCFDETDINSVNALFATTVCLISDR